jgi:hypothetical protein
MEQLKKVWGWLWSIGPTERITKDSADKLQMSMRVTAKCRYNAARRLHNQSQFSFLVVTLLSLGLIFIPLVLNAGAVLSLKPSILNMMQIFLAVSVLVYSVIVSTSRYEVRSTKLTDCGDRLKELIRGLGREREAAEGASKKTLEDFQRRYADVVTDSENHSRSDYYLATLEMENDYFISGFPRLWLYLRSIPPRVAPYLLPTILIGCEIVFITDMLGMTAIIGPVLNGVKDAPVGSD